MTADIVVGGLGGDGPIVTAGLGLSGAADPNAMRAVLRGVGAFSATLTAAGSPDMAASLNGSSALTATLTDGNAVGPDPTVGSIARLGGWQPQPIPRPIPGALSAHLAGASSLIADLTGVDRDAEAVLLLLDLDLMLTEGVLA